MVHRTMRQNLVSGQGETFTINLVYKDSNDDPVDLTGHSVTFRMLAANVGTVINETAAVVDNAGNITIKVEDEVTDTWPVGKNAYLVAHTNPNGDEKWLINGTLTIVGAASV